MAVMAAAVLVSTGAFAASTNDTEPNDTFGTAQDVDSFFDIGFNVLIEDDTGTNTSTTVPHVEVIGLDTQDQSYDVFSFVVPSGATITLDIDCAKANVSPCNVDSKDIDTLIALYDPVLALVDTDDDCEDDSGTTDTGNDVVCGDTFDSFLSYTDVVGGGTYRVQVADLTAFEGPSDDYILNISVTGHPYPVPSIGAFGVATLIGILGLTSYRRLRA